MEDCFEVQFKSGPFSFNLSPLPGGIGAVFDGWLSEKISQGENHDLLEVGDRLIMLDGNYLQCEFFSSIARILVESTKDSIALDQKDAEDGENDVYAKLMKYDLAAKTASRRRILKFSKPYRAIKIDIDVSSLNNKLGTWFYPGNALLCGARFAGLATTCVQSFELQQLKEGHLIHSINNKSVEGLKFDIVLDLLRESTSKISLRVSEQGLETSYSESNESKIKMHMKALNDNDAMFEVTGVSYISLHEKDFLTSIKEGNKHLFISRLQSGQTTQVRDELGRSPLMYAAKTDFHSLWFCRHLLAEHAAADSLDDSGRTALHCAAAVGNIEVCELLLDYSVNVNAQDLYGYTPLICAAMNSHLEIVKLLLRHNADVDTCEYEGGWTALHFAASLGREDILYYLIEIGNANIHLESNESQFSKTAIDLARMSNSFETASMLHEKLASEPLQLIWPQSSRWVIDDDQCSCADLVWRKGNGFTPYQEMRGNTLDSKSVFKKTKPPGRHDDDFESKRESVFNEARKYRLDEDNEVEGFTGQLWIGSRESLNTLAMNSKGINAVILITKEKDPVFGKSHHIDSFVLNNAPSDFGELMQEIKVRFSFYSLNESNSSLATFEICRRASKERPHHFNCFW